MIEEIKKEYVRASGSWTGCDWKTEFGRSGLNLKGIRSGTVAPCYRSPTYVDMERMCVETETQYRAIQLNDAQAANKWLAEVESDAALAEREAESAMSFLKKGLYEEAAYSARLAAKIELGYNRNKTWGRFAELFTDLEDLEDMLFEFRRVFGSVEVTDDGAIRIDGNPPHKYKRNTAMKLLQCFPDRHGKTEKGCLEVRYMLMTLNAINH